MNAECAQDLRYGDKEVLLPSDIPEDTPEGPWRHTRLMSRFLEHVMLPGREPN